MSVGPWATLPHARTHAKTNWVRPGSCSGTRAPTTCRHKCNSVQLAPWPATFRSYFLFFRALQYRNVDSEVRLQNNIRSGSWCCVLEVTTGPQVASETRYSRVASSDNLTRERCDNIVVLEWLFELSNDMMRQWSVNSESASQKQFGITRNFSN